MPNHVKNVWKIKGIKTEKERDYLLRKLAVQYHDKYKDTDEWIIDFDLIVPEPRFKKDCPKDCIVNKDSHVEEVKDRPWFNWYNFRLKYWGTKWGAYDGYTKIGKTQLTFVFSTAWSFPVPIANELAKLGYELEIRFADEDIGNNCGLLTFTKEDGWTEYAEADLTHPDKFANYIWSHY